MKKNIQNIIIIIAVALLFISINLNAAINLNLSAKLQTTLDSMVTMFANTKGMGASVYVPGQGIWKGSSGLSYAGQPITNDMLFGLASNSKLFTAVVLLKLAENNILDLDDSIRSWIPTFTNVNPNITIRQLLNHTSGLSDPFTTAKLLDSVAKYPTRVFTANEVLSYIGTPVYSPGAGYYYSNANYILAGMVAQSATGQSISELIRDSILTPLQMDSTFYDVEEAERGVIAHRWYNGSDWHDTSRVSLNTSGGAAGSLFTTTGEMAQWFISLIDGKIINSNSLTEMTTFVSSGNYGLGIGKFTFFGNTCWGHGGSTLGYKSRTIYDPSMKVYVCGLSNSNPSAVDGITATLYKVLVDYLPVGGGETITGNTAVCQGQTELVYQVPVTKNATSYRWTLPKGASGQSTTNSITVSFDYNAVSGDISVVGYNSYGEGNPSVIKIKVNPVYRLTENRSICQGESYKWLGKDYSIADTYVQNFSSVNGCDSIHTLNLAVNPKYSYSEEKTICQGETYSWHGQTYSIANTYTAKYTTIDGCDSTFSLKLNVNPTFSFTEEKTICDGESYKWHGSVFTTADMYTAKYSTINGCDSIYTLKLNVDTVPVGITLIDKTITTDYEVDSYQWLDCNSGFSSIKNETRRSFTPIQTGDYAVQLTKGSCTDTSRCARITIAGTGIEQAKEKPISIIPNPARDFIAIPKEIQNAHIEIYNLFGVEVQATQFNERIDISKLLPGIYYIKTTENVIRFIKI
jgi:CubicO group peptidase (beta-lactamase class C family)